MARISLLRMVGAVVVACGFLARSADAQQALPAYGRLSVYFTSGVTKDATARGEDVSLNEIITSMTFRSPEAKDGGPEFAFDGRGAAYPGAERKSRMSVYDGYVGFSTDGGRVLVRGGQMWLNEMGGLGSVAGGLVEVRRQVATGTRMRVGAFTGVEPSTMEIAYVPNVRKFGGYVVFDGGTARRQVLGYVTVRNQSITERSVVTFTNFLPVGRKLFLYQAGEYDLVGVAGNGGGRLSYFLTNARASAGSRIELQGTYHRGRSVDTRSLALDVLQGAAVSTQRVEGLFYESVGGRVWVTVAPHVRVNAAYSSDRTNSSDARTHRYQFGGNAWNLRGFDVYITRSSIAGMTRTYSAWDASVGRNIGARLYITGDYSTNLSSVRLIDDRGLFTLEHRPRTRRYEISTLANLTRHYSLLFTSDLTQDSEVTEQRFLAGLTVRF
jgi:hypothetical protein